MSNRSIKGCDSQMIRVKCLDPNCSQFNQRLDVDNRTVLLNHIKKKSHLRMIEVLTPHNIIRNYSVLSTYSLVNIFADCCYQSNATKLLEELDERLKF